MESKPFFWIVDSVIPFINPSIFTSLQMDQLRVNITRSVASRLEKFTPMEVVANIEVSHVRQWIVHTWLVDSALPLNFFLCCAQWRSNFQSNKTNLIQLKQTYSEKSADAIQWLGERLEFIVAGHQGKTAAWRLANNTTTTSAIKHIDSNVSMRFYTMKFCSIVTQLRTTTTIIY